MEFNILFIFRSFLFSLMRVLVIQNCKGNELGLDKKMSFRLSMIYKQKGVKNNRH
jgi:hypothetical protein